MTTLVVKTAAHCRRFVSNQSGATAIEYSLIAAGIAGVLITIMVTLGDTVKTKLYEAVANAL